MRGIVMAGGKSTRMGTEKLIISLLNKPVIEYTITHIENSKVEDYCIAVSSNAPETRKYLKNRKIISTPGNGYPEDIAFLSSYFEEPLLILNGDSTFVSDKEINEMLDHFYNQSMAGVVVTDKLEFIGLNIVVPGKLEDVYYYFKDPVLALNINTIEDLRRAEIMLKRGRETWTGSIY